MSTLDQWTAAVCADLGLAPGTADVKAILDLAREVAHNVDRPAAPLTAYLAGVAVGNGMDPAAATALIVNRAQAWAAQTQSAASKDPAQGQQEV